MSGTGPVPQTFTAKQPDHDGDLVINGEKSRRADRPKTASIFLTRKPANFFPPLVKTTWASAYDLQTSSLFRLAARPPDQIHSWWPGLQLGHRPVYIPSTDRRSDTRLPSKLAKR
jgi:hypothetical protein